MLDTQGLGSVGHTRIGGCWTDKEWRVMDTRIGGGTKIARGGGGGGWHGS